MIHSDLAEPLALIELAVRSAEAARERFPDYRLTRLVASRLELNDADIGQLAVLLRTSAVRPSAGDPRPFDRQLRHVIQRYGLETLFSDSGPGTCHHVIRPTGYDFHYDTVIPADMEKWRADYRALSSECQMLAASIIWLYRAGKDNRWLRRVPCTWLAADAIDHLRSTGGLTDWAHLFALYPGW